MGLLGNVAEVKTLRHRLMTSEFIKVFTDLLESSSDGIEVCLHHSSIPRSANDNKIISDAV